MSHPGTDSIPYYILGGKDEHEAIEVDVLTWGQWFESAGAARIVAQEQIGEYWISTVFLGLDHSFGGGPPELYETMTFKGGESVDCERCSTWDEAVAMHARAVEAVTVKV